MKKILLTVATALTSLSMFAAMTHRDSVETLWASKKLNTVGHQPKLVTFDFADTASAGLTFTKFWTHSAANNNAGLAFYKYSWDATEKALKIDVDFTIGGTVTPPATNYSAILNYNWVNYVDVAGTTAGFNPFTQADSVEGALLDISDKTARKFVMTCKAVNLSDSAQVRVDLSDANGRQSNNNSPKHTLKPTSGYQDMSFSWAEDAPTSNEWNQDMSEMVDGWSGAWLEVDTKRSATTFGQLTNGLPNLKAGGTGLYSLDSNNISKWNIQFNDGDKTSKPTDQTFSILIKKITIGDLLASSNDDYVFSTNAAFRTKAKLVKGGKKITPNVGSKFAFEGNGTMVNILGQVVAIGAGSIDASSVAAGVYYIIIDGVASKVIVK